MPIRHFNGESDELLVSIGACNLTGAFTIAALVRFGNKGTFADIVTNRESGGGARIIFYRSNTNKATTWINGTNSEVGAEIAEGSWYIVVVSKASGSVKPTIHLQKVGAAWAHTEGSAALANAASMTGGHIALGQVETGSGEAFKGDIAAVAEWTSALSNAEVEALGSVSTLSEWGTAKGAAGLWLFNQASVTEEVKDQTGNGANQSGRTGTTAIAEEPPIPYAAAQARLAMVI
jgi:Concanavalin A-like lectin/glucanases superfamily